MSWFTWPRGGLMALAAVFFLAMIIYGSSLGMFGDMFNGFFGSVGPSTATTATSSRAGTGTASASATRPAPTATVRR